MAGNQRQKWNYFEIWQKGILFETRAYKTWAFHKFLTYFDVALAKKNISNLPIFQSWILLLEFGVFLIITASYMKICEFDFGL